MRYKRCLRWSEMAVKSENSAIIPFQSVTADSSILIPRVPTISETISTCCQKNYRARERVIANLAAANLDIRLFEQVPSSPNEEIHSSERMSQGYEIDECFLIVGALKVSIKFMTSEHVTLEEVMRRV